MSSTFVRYVSAHGRCRKLWGSASQYDCVICEDEAVDWAYDHSDPSEVSDLIKDRNMAPARRRVTYSIWPEFYMPLCRYCHSQFDKDHAETKRAGSEDISSSLPAIRQGI